MIAKIQLTQPIKPITFQSAKICKNSYISVKRRGEELRVNPINDLAAYIKKVLKNIIKK